VHAVRSMFTSKRKDGVIVPDGVELREGDTVTVLLGAPANDDDELTPDQEAELAESEAALDRGVGVPWSSRAPSCSASSNVAFAIVLTPRAAREIAGVTARWRASRPEAPLLLAGDLSHAQARVSSRRSRRLLARTTEIASVVSRWGGSGAAHGLIGRAGASAR
jgi:hypothetical protein